MRGGDPDTAEELYAGAPVGYLSLDTDGAILRANQRFARLVGAAPETLPGTLLADWMTTGSKIYLDTHVFPLLYMQDGFQEVALDARTAAGDPVPLLADGLLVRDHDGEPIRIRMTLVDARQRRRYERELLQTRREAEEAQRQVDAILEATPEPLFAVDEEGRILNANAEARAFLGLDRREMRGRRLQVLLDLEDRDTPLLQGDGRVRSAFFETDMLRKGEETPIEIRWNALSGPGSVRYVVSIRDLRPVRQLAAERLEAEARRNELRRIQENDAFKSRIIDTTAHALRTPLLTMRLQIASLKDQEDPPPADRYRRALRILDRQSGRLHELSEQLIAAARLERHLRETATSRFPLRPIVDEIVREVADRARAKGLRFESGTIDLHVEGDASVVRQVLLALLDNAMKFTPEGGRVHLAAKVEGEQARIEVRDTGIGIPPDRLEQVFETFGQVHELHLTDIGVGLSLYLARRMLERDGGTIGAESRGRGRGSTFWFTLPLAPAPACEPDRASSPAPAPPRRG